MKSDSVALDVGLSALAGQDLVEVRSSASSPTAVTTANDRQRLEHELKSEVGCIGSA